MIDGDFFRPSTHNVTRRGNEQATPSQPPPSTGEERLTPPPYSGEAGRGLVGTQRVTVAARPGLPLRSLLLLFLLILPFITAMRAPLPLPKDEAEKTVMLTVQSALTMGEGQVAPLQVFVTNGYGAPAADLRVTLYVDDLILQEIETDGQGIGRFDLPSNLAPGDHRLIFQIKGRHGLNDGWAQEMLTVIGAIPLPPTSVPPTAIPTEPPPPTPAPPTAEPPTAEPPTAVPPTAVPPTAEPTQVPVVATVVPVATVLPTLLPVVIVSDSLSASVAVTLPVVTAVLLRPPLATSAPTALIPLPTPVSTIVAVVIATLPVATVPVAATVERLLIAATPSPMAATLAVAPPTLHLREIGLGFMGGIMLMVLVLMGLSSQASQRLRARLARIFYPFGNRPAQPDQRPLSNFQQLILNHIRQAKWGLLCALASMIGSALTDLISPWPLKIIFDYILLQSPLPEQLRFLDRLAQGNTVTMLLIVAAAIVAIALLQSSFAYLENYMTTRAGYQLVNTLRRELFLHFQRLSLTFHQESKRGELVFNVADDAQTLRDAFTDSALSLVTQVLTMIGMFAIMFYVNWRLSLIPLVTFPLLFIVYLFLQRRLKTQVRTLRKKEGQIAAQLTENLAIMPVIQAFGREQHEADRFDLENSQNLESGIRIAQLSARLNRTIEIISEVGLAAVIFVGAWLALRGSMTPGDVLIFVTYVRTLYKPVRQMVKMSTKLNSAWVAGQRIAAVLDIEPEIADKPNAVVAQKLRGALSFEQVAFHYKAGQPILRDVSFQIKPGQRVALVGPSGAGKSTITSLLLRLYDPSQGTIRIDGLDLRDYQRASLRQQIGLVLQDSMLFGATIRENICYGKPDATQAEVEQAARQAHIHDFIAALPKGYETPIGEMGSTLSGGQRQRIAIARALVKEPSILILDEPTSALDAESKALVDATINNLQRGKTVLVIAHQLSSIQSFDQIIVMAQGRVVERGTHAELLARRGVYADLYQLQNNLPAPASADHNGLFAPSLAMSLLAGAD